MKGTSRATLRLLAVPVVVATALSVGPGLTGISQAVPPTGSFLNPSATGPGNVISDKLDGTNGTYRFLVRAGDNGSGVSSVQIQTEDCDADTNFETIGTATRVGSTDTYEYQWDISAYTPATDVAACATGLVRALVTAGNAETSFIGGSGGQAVIFNDSAAETAAITTPANGGNPGFFAFGAQNLGNIRGTASAGATAVTGYYSTSALGTDPNWAACGTDSALVTPSGGTTQTFDITCDLGATAATSVTALGVLPAGGTADSGDAVRVSPVAQTLQSMSITPSSDTQSTGFCNTYAVQLRDAGGNAIIGVPIQVQVVGTTATATNAQDAITFADNSAAEGTSSDPFAQPAAGPFNTTAEATNQCDSAGETDGRLDDVDGAAGSNEGVVAAASAPDTKAIAGVTKSNGDYKFSLALPNDTTGNAAAGNYAISAFIDANGDGVQNAGEAGATATKTYQTQTETGLTASPPTATNVIGENHTITATLVDQNGNPVSGQPVTFRVTSGPSTNSDIDGVNTTPNGVIDICTTAANGKCSVTYTSNTAGTDNISVFRDTNNNFVADAGEKQTTVTKTWITTSTATCLDLEPNSAENPTTSAHTITAYVTDGALATTGDNTDANGDPTAARNDCGGNPLANVPVDFTLNAGGPAATLAPDNNGDTQHERVFTNAQGVATVTLTDDSSTATGTNTVTGAIPGSGFSMVSSSIDNITATGTLVPTASSCDDCVSPSIALPFPFTYDGTAFNGVYVSSNGFLNFGNDGEDGCCSGDSYPDSGAPNGGVIGGDWGDLVTSGNVFYQTLGVAPNRRFVVQFSNVGYFSGAGTTNFEIKLFEGSNNVEVHYGAISAHSTDSGGVENIAGTGGTQYFRGTNAGAANTAVQYTPAAVSGRRAETVSKDWAIAGQAETIDCTPKTGRNLAGSQHTVTCTVLDHFNNPVVGKSVGFRVSSGPDSTFDLDSNPITPPGYFGEVTTNSQGQASATYTNLGGNSNTPDTIRGFVDENTNSLDDDALADTVTKYWVSSSNISGARIGIDMNPTGAGTNDTPVGGPKNTKECDASLANNSNFGTATNGWDATTSGTVRTVEAVCVAVLGADGQPQYGESVTLTSSGVGVITNDDGTATGTSSQTKAVDPSTGYALFYITSNQSGTQSLTASAANVPSSANATGSKTWGSLAGRTLTIANVGGNTATPGSTHQVTATVLDRLGNPVSGAWVDFTESGPGRFLNGTSTEPSTVSAQTGANGTVTVELTSQSTESGTETVSATLQDQSDCTKAAGNPSGAPAGVCTAGTSFSWTTGTSSTFRILAPANYYTTVAGGTFANFSGVGGVPGETLTVHRKIGNGSYTTMAGPTVGSDGSWIYSLKVTTTTAVYFTGGNGTTGVKVILTRLNITFPSTYYYTVAKGQRTAIYGSGARPGAVLEIWTKSGNQKEFVKRTNTVTATYYGTWALRFNVYQPMAIYFRGVNGKSDVVVYRVQ
jgi:hypothetical protein